MQDEITQPVVKQALGTRWDDLSAIVRRHYDMCPGEPSALTITGTMEEVFHSKMAKPFLLPARFFGALIPYSGRNIPTHVTNRTLEDDRQSMFWHRQLQFPGRPTSTFRSRMVYLRDDEIIEYVRFGLGIRMRLSVEHDALIFTSRGYLWNLGWFSISIPDWLLLGQARIIEQAISDDDFRIDFDITHPLFGRTFGYRGTFSITHNSAVAST